MRRVLRSPITYVAVVLVVAVVLIIGLQGGASRTRLATGTFEGDLAVPGRVVSATIHDGSDEVTGKLADGTSYVADYPAGYTAQITQKVSAAVPAFETDHSHTNPWLTALVDYLPFLVLLGGGFYLFSTMQGGGGRIAQFGKSRARAATKDQQTLTFADVAGADEAVAELQEIKEFLESPARFQALGAKIPKGVLLFGPPGTGKTLLARAVAGEAGVPFFSISGSDFVEMFVGVGASRVRDLFAQAKANAPAIVFMDEIDAVGRQRGAGLGGGNDEREQTLNQLLVEMDGFDARGGIILIAATNRPDVLDPALLRPGRFDRQIAVDRPDRNGRRRILEVHARSKPLHPGVSLDVLAQRTPGFTGADLANLLNEAALLTARRNLRQIGIRECEEAIDRVLAGPERKALVMSDHDKLVTAYHEAGHVIVGHVLPDADPIHKVSIVARSRSLGLTFTLPEDRYNHSRSQLRDAMAMCLGGRTAEELVFHEPTTGAENDIERASGIARAMVTEYGMSEVLGPRQLAQGGGDVLLGRELGHQVRHSPQIAGVIDQEIQMLIDEAHQRARDILGEHRATLDLLAKELVERETLDTPDLMALIGELGSWPTPAVRSATTSPAPTPGTGAPTRRPLTAAGRAVTPRTSTPRTSTSRTPTPRVSTPQATAPKLATPRASSPKAVTPKVGTGTPPAAKPAARKASPESSARTAGPVASSKAKGTPARPAPARRPRPEATGR